MGQHPFRIFTIEGKITDDGQLIIDLPENAVRGPVWVTIESQLPYLEEDEEDDEAAEPLWSAGDLFGLGQTAEEIANAPEIGSWADNPITDSAAYVRALRHSMFERRRRKWYREDEDQPGKDPD